MLPTDHQECEIEDGMTMVNAATNIAKIGSRRSHRYDTRGSQFWPLRTTRS